MKTILITGASKGIGAELAIQLASGKNRLILLSRNGKLLNVICDKCNNIAGAEIASPLTYDLNSLLNDDREFVLALKSMVTSLDVLVNNAGMLVRKSFANITVEESKAVFDANYFAPSQLIKSCLPLLLLSKSASVLNITSMGAFQGSVKFPGLSVYSSSKGALSTLTECLAEEFKELNIRVNALAIGAVQTEMLNEAFPGYVASTSPTEMGSLIKWFVLEGYKRFNGKILPVADSTP